MRLQPLRHGAKSKSQSEFPVWLRRAHRETKTEQAHGFLDARFAANWPLILALLLLSIGSSGCAKQEKNEEDHLSCAKDYFCSRQISRCREEYHEVLRVAPSDPAAARGLGLLYHQQAQYVQA